MVTATVLEALRGGKRLELRYDGFSRVVEVHAVGLTDKGREVARVWQVRGGSESGEGTGWKMFRLDEALSARMIDEKSEAPRHGYKRNDKNMVRILGQI